MPVSALVTTAGSATANAYVSILVADQYFLDRPNGETWATYSSDQKTAAILWATKLMDSLWVWNGYPVDAVQALLWPRGGMLKRNGWEYVPLNIIPIELQQATAEYAGQLQATNRTADNAIETGGITSVQAGPVRVTFKDSVFAKVVPDAVYNLIPHGQSGVVFALGSADWGYVRGTNSGVRQTART